MPEPIRIICFVTTLDQGGTERNLVQYCRSIDRSRFLPEVWYLHETETTLRPLLEEVGIRTVCLGAPKSFSPLFLLKTARRLKHSGADLIHLFLPTVGYYAVASRFLYRSKIPMLYSCGGVQLLLPLQGAMMKYGLGRYCFPVVGNSEVVLDFWRDMNVDEQHLRLIYNGHDLARFSVQVDRQGQRKQLGLDPEVPVIITVGRLVESKRHVDLLDACAELDRSGFPCQLLIVGDGPCRDALEQKTEQLGLQPYVQFLGTREDIVPLMRASDLFAFPSESEGLPNAVIEAALCKLPIVAANIKPVREVIEDGRSGTTVPVHDAGTLAKAIKTVLSDRSGSQQMAEIAFREAAHKFDLQRTIGQLEAVYHEALIGKRETVAPGGAPS
ncbi:MAG: glycosyltransferase [Mariniblastus sp.]|nr:glycosyltransferase [Mariniblastus sp.]